MKLIPLIFLSFLITACDDTIRSRSTISESTTSNALRASLSPKAGTVANIYKTSEIQSFNTEGDEISVTKSTLNSFIKFVILKAEGNFVYKLIETRTSENAVERKVQLEYIDLNTELNDLVKKRNATITGDIIKIDMKLSPSSISEPQFHKNQMLKFDTESDFEAIYSLNKPFCEFRSVLTMTTNLHINGDYHESAVTEIWERASCAKEMSLSEIKNLDLRAISFCDETASNKKCEIKNLEHLKP